MLYAESVYYMVNILGIVTMIAILVMTVCSEIESRKREQKEKEEFIEELIENCNFTYDEKYELEKLIEGR